MTTQIFDTRADKRMIKSNPCIDRINKKLYSLNQIEIFVKKKNEQLHNLNSNSGDKAMCVCACANSKHPSS